MITLTSVSKTYNPNTPKAVRALIDVSFTVAPGEMVAVMGPSGSGKSTLLRLIGCTDWSTAGELTVLNENVSKLSEKKRAFMRSSKIGFVFQDFALLGDRSCLENVMLPMYFSKMPLKEGKQKATKALISLGLSDKINIRPNELSGGQQQRVAIARAIASGFPLILADEPTGALDMNTGEEIVQIFENMKESGTTFVIVTHNPQIAKHCDRVLQLLDGRLISE